MELGGNIILNGFENLPSGELVIVKKIVGQFAKQLSENVNGFEGIEVEHTNFNNSTEIKTKLKISGEVKESSAKDKNIFIALSKSIASF